MNSSLQSKINDLVNNGYQVEIGKYINIAWENFKKTPLMYIGYLLVLGAVTWAAGKLPLDIGNFLLPIFSIGFALFANKIQRNEKAEFTHFFDGFKSNPVHLILVGIVTSLIMLMLTLPMVAHVGFGNIVSFIMNPYEGWGAFSGINTAKLAIWGGLAAIPAIYLSVAWSWAYYFVAFKGLDFWPAMEASRKVITKQWFSFFGFFLALVGIALAGALCFGVGLLVAIPVITIASFIAFEQIIGLNGDEIDFIDELIDDE